MKQPLLVTAALPYANGPIHIGHLVEYIQADVWVRYQRLTGRECVFVCADDAHGTPIMLSARKKGVEPEQLIADIQASHAADFRDFRIDFDIFHSTHSDENRELVSLIYERLQAGGHIERRTIQQAYDEQVGMFLPDRFVKGGCPRCGTADQYGDSCENCGATYAPMDLTEPRSVLSGTVPVVRDSDHLFIAAASLEDTARSWLDGEHVQPEVRNKLAEWFDEGLRDWDISRDAPYWGFEIPGEQDKFFYVWLDAPIGYMASHLRWCRDNGRDFWPTWEPGSDVELVHFIGKDIAYFHTLFWPAVLDAASLRLPSAVHCHGFLTVDGRKMSKSRGTFIAARTWLEHLDPETLRYYFASKLGDGIDDVDLSLDEFVYRVNADLIGKVVNVASRCCSILRKRYDNRLSDALPDPDAYQQILDSRDEIGALYDSRQYSRALRQVSELAGHVNRYIDAQAPWALVKDEATFEDGRDVCTQAINIFRGLITLLAPVVPRIAEDAAALLQSPISWQGLDQPLLGRQIARYKPLIMRLEPDAVQKVVDASRPA